MTKFKSPAFISCIKGLTDGASENFVHFSKVFLSEVAEGQDFNLKPSYCKSVLGLCFNAFNVKSSGVRVDAFAVSDAVGSNFIYTSSPDCPFLVDSIINYFNDSKIEIIRAFHPVYSVVRGGGGEIINFEESGAGGSAATEESLICIEIGEICEEGKVERIKSDILRIVSTALKCSKDWKVMSAKVASVMDTLSVNVKSFNDHGALLSNEVLFKGITAEDLSFEIEDFSAWLQSGNFIYLGLNHFVKNSSGEWVDGNCKLGLFGIDGLGLAYSSEPLSVINGSSNEKFYLEVTKSVIKSPIHVSSNMDYIRIQEFGVNGQIVGEYVLFGLFTTNTTMLKARDVPFVRFKFNNLISSSNLPEHGFSVKEFVSILDTLPKSELMRASQDALLKMCFSTIALNGVSRGKVFASQDRHKRFISFICYIPKDKFSSDIRQRVNELLRSACGGEVMSWGSLVTDGFFAKQQIFIKTNRQPLTDDEMFDLEGKLNEIISSWQDLTKWHLIETQGYSVGQELFEIYGNAFPKQYMESYRIATACWDIVEIEKSFSDYRDICTIYQSEGFEGTNMYNVKIYRVGEKMSLFEMMPVLENFGLKVLNEYTYQICPDGRSSLWLNHFKAQCEIGDHLKLQDIKENFEIAATLAFKGRLENDGLNKLVPKCNLNYAEVEAVRAVVKYLKQIGFKYNQDAIEQILFTNYKAVCLLVELFHLKFSPTISLDALTLKARVEDVTRQIHEFTEGLTDVAADETINKILEVVESITRTNFFQAKEGGGRKDYISFKVDSAKIKGLAKPKMFAEIFVYSYYMEGIHLRAGKVSRGGIRWSDRNEDFRTEVLGLVKAQTPKNAVIVPVGSKGGFVVKNHPVNLQKQKLQAGIDCYKTLLMGMLDVTDNVVGGAIVAPQNVKRLDADDPYLVVAADKGTATFSDIANEVAESYGFWLGDAFASGGSAGYDHKKMGITAKGAWVAVQRHFQEMGVDVQAEEFTAVGIGDLAGDVFGNGVLLSRKMKLLAAFNHMHIFVDPMPDCEESFKERERMFKMPKSTWQDYDMSKVSKGGGIFERSSKSIVLSSEMKVAFSIEEDISSCTPNELIRFILKAEVDLLWNGGIGTFVKGSQEDHKDAKDKTNDELRVNGNELRCKVVGEGGNLGFTQKGRIEYANNGGKVNTDFIDNSAGVDCSDHEVNIKIALQQAVADGIMNLKERNDLLLQMTDEVSSLVLRDNFLQTQSISTSLSDSAAKIENHARIISKLEDEGFLDRASEFLPQQADIKQMQLNKKSFSRPELCVLFSYSKLFIFEQLMASKLVNESYFNDDALQYFPAQMQEKFEKYILSHQLRREIVGTHLTNAFVNRLGITFWNVMQDDTGAHMCDIVRSFVILKDIFELDGLWSAIENAGQNVAAQAMYAAFIDIKRFMERGVYWLLRNRPHPLDIEGIIGQFSQKIKLIVNYALKKIKKKYSLFGQSVAGYVNDGFDTSVAERIATLNHGHLFLDILKIEGQPPETAVDLYLAVGERLKIDFIINSIRGLNTTSHWDKTIAKISMQDIRDHQCRISCIIAKAIVNGNAEAAINEWFERNKKSIVTFESFVNNLLSDHEVVLPMFVIIERKLSEIGRV